MTDKCTKPVPTQRGACGASERAPSCSQGCTTECLAQLHGCASECPALPHRPPFVRVAAPEAERGRDALQLVATSTHPRADSDLAGSLRESLMRAQQKGRELAIEMEALRSLLQAALRSVVTVGSMLDKRKFGHASVAAGNARGARQFEVASEPRLGEISTIHPELTRFVIDAWPVNDVGKRMSGRAGNSRTRSDTVILRVDVCRESIDDTSDGAEILMRSIQLLLDSQHQPGLPSDQKS